MSQKLTPVHLRVMQKIATYFDNEEKGYLFLTIKGQEKVANQTPQPADPDGLSIDPEVFADALKLASNNPAKFAEFYEKTCARLTPEQVAWIEKKAAHDVAQMQAQLAQTKQAEVQKGIWQFEGFQMAMANQQQYAEKTASDRELQRQAPALARAAGFSGR